MPETFRKASSGTDGIDVVVVVVQGCGVVADSLYKSDKQTLERRD